MGKAGENIDDNIDSKYITLDEFKKFLNLEGIDLDEDILNLTLEAAMSYCSKRNETQYTKDNCPKEARYAALALAAFYFECRSGEERQSEKVILKGVDRLLDIAREKFTL